MKTIPNAQALIGMLGNGELNEELTRVSEETFAELLEMSNDNPKAKHKGSITLTLNLEAASGMITIMPKIDTKTPERPRRSTVYWITEGGKLSTEHPQQHDMFSGPREIERAR